MSSRDCDTTGVTLTTFMDKKGYVLTALAMMLLLAFLGGVQNHLSYWGKNRSNNAKPVSIDDLKVNHTSIKPPVPIEVCVIAGNDKIEFSGDLRGLFPPVTVPTGVPVSVRLKIEPHARLQQVALDGGCFGNQSNTEVQQADENGNLEFQFKTGNGTGNYRVASRYRGQMFVLNFWASKAAEQ